MNTQQEIIIKLVLDAWYLQINRVDNLFNSLTNEQLQKEISPTRNRGVYLLGHLTAVHDRLLPLLGLGERLYPQLDELFIVNPDKAIKEIPTIENLKLYWKNVNKALVYNYELLQADDWLQKHTDISKEEFQKEPHRNRINVLINRTNHLSYHFGQLKLLKK